MALQIKPLVWVVENILPEGLIIFAGKPKMGKSMLALDLALCVARGSVALGGAQVDEGATLYLALEDGHRRLQDRILKLAGTSVPGDLHLWTDVKQMDVGGLDQIDDWLKIHPGTRLVVIDTLARFRPQAKRGANVYLEDYQLLAQLKSLADRHHVALMLIHHLRKETGVDPLEQISGSTGLTGAADTILIMTRTRGNQSEAQLLVTGRDVEETKLTLQSDAQSMQWKSVLPAQGQNVSKERSAILDALRLAGMPLGPTAVAQMVNKPTNDVKQLLHKMLKDGQIEQPTPGKYGPVKPTSQT
jgi:RecA-family ATPase